jgi:hypothetical protein
MKVACVPFPAPGAPKRIRRMNFPKRVLNYVGRMLPSYLPSYRLNSPPLGYRRITTKWPTLQHTNFSPNLPQNRTKSTLCN